MCCIGGLNQSPLSGACLQDPGHLKRVSSVPGERVKAEYIDPEFNHGKVTSVLLTPQFRFKLKGQDFITVKGVEFLSIMNFIYN